MESKVIRPDMSLLRFMGLRKNFWVYNKSSKRARVIITTTAIGRITKIGVDKFSADIQWEGSAKETDEVISAGRRRKFYSETSQVYLTIFIEIDSVWKQLRKNKLLQGWRQDYHINDNQFVECMDIIVSGS